MKVSQPPVTGEVSTARVQLYLCVPLYALNNSIVSQVIQCTRCKNISKMFKSRNGSRKHQKVVKQENGLHSS